MMVDLREALRQLRKAPGFTATAVIALALGDRSNDGYLYAYAHAVGSCQARGRHIAALLGRFVGLGNPGFARSRRGANGGNADRVIQDQV